MDDGVNEQGSLFGINKPEVKKEAIVKSDGLEVEEVVDGSEEDVTYKEKLCELNNHNWRDAYLKNSTGTKHIVYCIHCTRTKFNHDGSIKQWLLDQGYVEEKNEEHQISDFGYGKI